MRIRTGSRLALALSLAAGAVACENAGALLGFGAAKAGTVFVLIYLDRDGSHTPSGGVDTVFAHARVALLSRGSNDTLLTAASDAAGLATFEGVPVGQYRVAIVPSSIGDSIEVGAIDSALVSLTAVDSNRTVLVRLGYPEVSIRAARLLPLGKRVFVRGVILAGVQSFSDTTSHVSDSSGQIRLTRVSLRGGFIGNSPGDSVSVLGLVSSRAGQPTLDNSIITRFGARPPPIPLSVSTATAAQASGGLLDAGLVQITGAVISDTATIAPNFRVTASDGSGSLKIILDANLPFPRNAFVPGRSMNVRGVLVPDGAGGWNLKPRDLNDVVLN